MKPFCPNCEKETDAALVCEVYSCNECNEDYENYEKPLLKRAEAAEARLAELRVRVEAAQYLGVEYDLCGEWAKFGDKIIGMSMFWPPDDTLTGIDSSNPDISTTQDVLIDIKTAPDNNPDYNNRD